MPKLRKDKQIRKSKGKKKGSADYGIALTKKRLEIIHAKRRGKKRRKKDLRD